MSNFLRYNCIVQHHTVWAAWLNVLPTFETVHIHIDNLMAVRRFNYWWQYKYKAMTTATLHGDLGWWRSQTHFSKPNFCLICMSHTESPLTTTEMGKFLINSKYNQNEVFIGKCVYLEYWDLPWDWNRPWFTPAVPSPHSIAKGSSRDLLYSKEFWLYLAVHCITRLLHVWKHVHTSM